MDLRSPAGYVRISDTDFSKNPDTDTEQACVSWIRKTHSLACNTCCIQQKAVFLGMEECEMTETKLENIEGMSSYMEDDEISRSENALKARCFSFSIKTHDADGNEVFSLERAVEVFQKYKSIKKFGVILHDEDEYHDPGLLANYNTSHADHPKELGDPVDPHVQGTGLLGDGSVEVSKIARWFGVPENFINVLKPSAFLDYIQYLTHEKPKQQNLGKHLYPDEKIISNFDWRAEINERDELRKKYGKTNVIQTDKLKLAIMSGEMNIDQIREEHPLEYANNIDKFTKLQKDYNRRQPAPTIKINMYIGGVDGGVGKGLMGKAVARGIVDPLHEKADDEIYFLVTSDSGFNGYNGQPVLIWEDFRPQELLAFFGRKNGQSGSKARGEMFKFLDPHPGAGSGMVDVKYDNVRLQNIVNIFDCILEPDEWLDGLAGEYTLPDGTVVSAEEKQKSQIYRRIPITFWIMENDYSFRINKGVLEDTREYNQWVESQRFRGSLSRLVNTLNNTQYTSLSDKLIKPALSVISDYKDKLEVPHREYTDSELEEMFGDYGSIVDQKGQTSLEKNREKMKKNHSLKHFKEASLNEIEEQIWETRKKINELEFEISDYESYNKFMFVPLDLDMLQNNLERETSFLEELIKIKETKLRAS